MSNLVLFDDLTIRPALLPFTFTRPVAGIRIGIQTLAEKWADALGQIPSYLTESYLAVKFPQKADADNWYVNGAVCPTAALQTSISALPVGSCLHTPDGLVLAVRTDKPLSTSPTLNDPYEFKAFAEPLTIIRNLWDIFVHNGDQIRADFARLTAGRQSAPITDPFTRCYAPENIFVEEGATIRASVLNAEGGPIYIGRNATISEGSVVIGPFSLGESSTVNWGGKMRSNTTIGPFCKVGGEVGNSVFFGYSNKGHDGFLGNSVVGEWCNLGANTNNSNLKNDYSNVKLYSYATGQLEDTGRIFCGLMMGDFTKAGISTMFNTGTVVGVSVNVFGSSFQPKYIRSFSWGGASDGFMTYRLEKAIHVATEAFKRRDLDFDEQEENILREIFNIERMGPPTITPLSILNSL
ncbi:putative sugar nucleotidyl transferase [Spirosoma endbachense]|uniref:Glucose-1-phosphate thymidylyltransferase n=1 Tax=Spirosoma endbachense TaxID=2666025 RepID=A0A6P1W0M6_9BACT|nr:putative sugar nucleotidyl transferase [Spirosoma endbachense]QHV98943.1 glucose-1-phosphate thymidylyltransferase [Spirosoma endbachense]